MNVIIKGKQIGRRETTSLRIPVRSTPEIAVETTVVVELAASPERRPNMLLPPVKKLSKRNIYIKIRQILILIPY